ACWCALLVLTRNCCVNVVPNRKRYPRPLRPEGFCFHHFPSDGEFLLKVKQRCPTGFLRKVPNRCSFIFCEAWRRVHNASYNHRNVRYRRTTLGQEGHSDLDHATLKPGAG